MEGIDVNWGAWLRPEYGWRILGLIITWVIVWLLVARRQASPTKRAAPATHQSTRRGRNLGEMSWIGVPRLGLSVARMRPAI